MFVGSSPVHVVWPWKIVRICTIQKATKPCIIMEKVPPAPGVFSVGGKGFPRPKIALLAEGASENRTLQEESLIHSTNVGPNMSKYCRQKSDFWICSLSARLHDEIGDSSSHLQTVLGRHDIHTCKARQAEQE
jgi:hypothetical protein